MGNGNQSERRGRDALSHRSLAAAQTVPQRGDVAANVAQHVQLAHIAADAHAQIVVFPELSLTGYELDLARALAFSGSVARLAELIDVAESRNITIVAGAPVAVGTYLHIGAFIISPDGAVQLYTKHHLGAFSSSARVDGDIPPAEGTLFDAGNLNPLVTCGGSPAAFAICADTGRAAHAQLAAQRGAQTYLASMFTIPSEYERESATLATYARQHRMAVVMANYGGPTGGLAAAGRSAIWSPNGELLAQLEHTGAGVVIATENESGWRAARVKLIGAPVEV